MDKIIDIRVEGQSRGGPGGPAADRAGVHPLHGLQDHPEVRSLYIHVPFCFHKCHYCDFYSFVDSQDRQSAFVDALILELTALARHAPGAGSMRGAADAGVGGARLDTIFVGGGTPSLLRPDLWGRLLGALHGLFDLRVSASGTAHKAPEFTVECNPETVTEELMGILAAGGVNRVSVGAQSFNERHLKTLERWHDPENVARALELAARAGVRRRSIDLIFGVPGQTLDEWRSDLHRALSVCGGIEHISCYALTYEPNTAMTQRLNRGEFTRVDEDLEADMFLLTLALLRERGFERYEVSNFARPGCECRHNLAYWRQEPWLAAGPSASAHVAGRRWKNVPRLTDWMQGVGRAGGYAPIVDFEGADPRRALAERLMTGLRLSEGVSAREMLARAGPLGSADRLERCAEKHRRAGNLVESDSACWRLSDPGFLFADGIASEFMACL